MDLMFEVMDQMKALSAPVQIWTVWLMGTFMFSLVFISNKPFARWVLASLIATMVLAMTLFYFTRNAHLFGIPHLLLWTPLLYYVFKKIKNTKKGDFSKLYYRWLMILYGTIIISLIFDVRDIILVLTGKK